MNFLPNLWNSPMLEPPELESWNFDKKLPRENILYPKPFWNYLVILEVMTMDTGV